MYVLVWTFLSYRALFHCYVVHKCSMENCTVTVCVYLLNFNLLLLSMTAMLFDELNTTTNNNNNRSPLQNCIVLGLMLYIAAERNQITA